MIYIKIKVKFEFSILQTTSFLHHHLTFWPFHQDVFDCYVYIASSVAHWWLSHTFHLIGADSPFCLSGHRKLLIFFLF